MGGNSIRHVLLVDDKPEGRAELRDMLALGSAQPLTFTEADTGQAALQLLADRGPADFDCVLLGHDLPDMTARDLLDRLCRTPGQALALAPLPVLVMTALHDPDGCLLVRAGAQDCIGKSWSTPQRLARAVDHAIERFALQQEARRVQQALALERTRLGLALTAGQMGVYELNLADGALSWSPEVYALFGLEPETFVPTRASFRTLVHPQDRAIPWQALYDAGQPATHEYRIQRPDGQWRWIAQRGQTRCDADGADLRHTGVVFDITERKRVEAEHAQFEQRLRDQQFYTRSLIEASSDALVVTDPSGNVTDVNKHMETLTGRTRAELIGAPFASLFNEPARASDCLAGALARRQLREHDELSLLAPGGGATPVSLNASTFHDRQRALHGVVFAARDVTQRRFLDTALQETHCVLEAARFLAHQASERKSSLMLRTRQAMREPLGSINEQARRLQRGPRLTAAAQAEAAEDILRACRDLLEQIEQASSLADGGPPLGAPAPRVMAGVNPPA